MNSPTTALRTRAESASAPDGRLTLALAGARIELDASGALWLESERTLVVSDLHLEKGSAYAARGVALPPFDTAETLRRLAAAIEARAPRRVIALGDSFHDVEAGARMSASDLAMLGGLIGRVEEWIWIAGNHDPAPPSALAGRTLEELKASGLTFRHEPTGAFGEVAGHLHPCARVRGRGRTVRRRCFVSDGARLIMPAFGAFTGGLNVCDRAFAEAFPEGAADAHVIGARRVWTVRPDSLAPDV